MRSPGPTEASSSPSGLATLLVAATALVGATCAPGGRAGPGCIDEARQWTLPGSIPEASGVAVSHRHDGILWVHDDGQEGLLWALAPDSAEPGTELAPVARVRVPAVSRDWEALEGAACPGAIDAPSCLWIADTGNNGLYRDTVQLLVIAEPELEPPSTSGGLRTVQPRVLRLRYPDARRDVEALFVADGDPWLVSKGNAGGASLYRVPLPSEWSGRRSAAMAAPGSSDREPVAAVKAQELAPEGLNLVRQFTGAATVPRSATAIGPGPATRTGTASATGSGRGAATRVLLRSYTQLRLFELDGDSATPVEGGEVNLMSLREPQGEGVAVGADGRVWLVSESGPTATRGGLSLIRCSELSGG